MEKIFNKIKKNPKINKILKNKAFQKYEKWVLVIIWAGAIYYFSNKSLNFLAAPGIEALFLRKLGHMVEFGVLCFLIFRILGQTEKRHIYWNLFWAVVFSVLYAVSDEYHQSLIQGRVGTYTDVIIDSAGVLIAAWLIYLHYHHVPVKLKPERENIE